MKKTIVVCDRCNKQEDKVKGIHSLSVFEDRKMDAAGSMENIYEDADLCGDCMKIMINEIVKTDAAREIVLNFIKKIKRSQL
jgi:hypothetical protein